MTSKETLMILKDLIALMAIILLCGFFIYLILISLYEKNKLKENIKKQEKIIKLECKQGNMNAKYIKTQAGIYKIKNGKFLENFDVEKYSKDFPVRFADTIEELCDRFIVRYQNDYSIFSDFRDLKKHYDYYEQDYHKVIGRYGAIWTDDGLKYIAKMNKDGKFELL